MRNIGTIEQHLPEVAQRIRNHGGFLTEEDMKAMAENDATRLVQVLVRCGNGRFVCPAQDAQHFINIISRTTLEDKHNDYVRDVSLPA